MIPQATLGPKQTAWCRSHLFGFVDADGKTRLEKRNAMLRDLERRKHELIKQAGAKHG